MRKPSNDINERHPHRFVTIVVVASILFSSCKKIPGICSTVKSARNGVTCDVDYSLLKQDRLSGIRIFDSGISEREKIRHLNELNNMPKEFLNVMRGDRVSIHLTDGAITNLPLWSHLKGVKPRGWPDGLTWDIVPGAGDFDKLALGDSSLNNFTGSLAIHEAAHSVSFQTNIMNSPEFLEAWTAEQNRPHPDDEVGPYRTSYSGEYIAVAVDDYYCNQRTRDLLKLRYPKAYIFVDKHFTRLLAESGRQTEPAGTGAPMPSSIPSPTAQIPSIPIPQHVSVKGPVNIKTQPATNVGMSTEPDPLFLPRRKSSNESWCR